MLAGLWLAICASPALAADQQVQVKDDFFQATTVAVKPGETVTWTSSVAARPHNVSFDDATFTAPSAPQFPVWTRPRTFSTPGVFRYHCQLHGGFGGQGMSGIVHVNESGTIPGAAPTASFTVSPAVAAVNSTVTLNGGASSDSDGTITKYQWDLDGNGEFETDTGTAASTTFTPFAVGARTIGLRVTDNNGATGATTRQLTVTSRPTAQFTVAPATAQINETVSFDAGASTDADGTIARYEWDLSTAQTTPVVNCATLSGAARAGCMQKACRSLRGTKRASCIGKSCRYLKGARRASCVQSSCRHLAKGKRAACARSSCRFLTGAQRSACVRRYRKP